MELATSSETPSISYKTFPGCIFVMDNITHSFVTAFFFISIMYYFKRELVWPMLSWPFHIVLDFAFHTKELFPVKLFWPLTDFYIDGISWSHPAVWFSNAAGIVILFIYRWRTKQNL